MDSVRGTPAAVRQGNDHPRSAEPVAYPGSSPKPLLPVCLPAPDASACAGVCWQDKYEFKRFLPRDGSVPDKQQQASSSSVSAGGSRSPSSNREAASTRERKPRDRPGHSPTVTSVSTSNAAARALPGLGPHLSCPPPPAASPLPAAGRLAAQAPD